MHEIIRQAMELSKAQFEKVEETALINQRKVLDAFIANKIALRHFTPTTGYGYDDVARDTLAAVYKTVFGTEDALVSPLITSGTHALTIALFGLLRPNQTLLCATGNPYDTLNDVIFGDDIGSLKDFGVKCEIVPLKGGLPDISAIKAAIRRVKPSVVMIQRSRGYDMRPALNVAQINQIISLTDKDKTYTLVDNCYGEFVETVEPSEADAIVGSLIKNPGGGIAPTGGYICGSARAIRQIEGRLTAPSIGREVGSYAGEYRPFYQGLFLAPHTTMQSLKTAMLFSQAFTLLGYETLPKPNQNFDDIICSVKFGNKDKLIDFCKTVQSVSPVDSFAVPEPWDMPGYNDQVIMAAGAFVQGASIELSCDAPIRPPYIAYFQGGLTFEHGIIVLEKCLEAIGAK
ncbi:MAG: methionine gamma-lyase family protein [Clostridiales bacterium]|nr:methionine gamma-lyase family protein [Clostridiales bacterium]